MQNSMQQREDTIKALKADLARLREELKHKNRPWQQQMIVDEIRATCRMLANIESKL